MPTCRRTETATARPAAACACHAPDRRRVLGLFAGAALAVAGPRPARAGALEAPAGPDDERFMRIALQEAAKADLPFGAVIVRDGVAVARGRNLGKTTNDPTAHGEMVAIRRFLDVNPAADLKGATLYTTGEPCPMCMSAIVWCGIGRVVFAASIEELSTKIRQIMVPAREIAEKTPFLTVSLTGGVLAKEAMALFR
jgi:tRNA(adenine34) deaminase